MRKLISASLGVLALAGMVQAATADAPVKQKARYRAPPPVVWTWTGFYVGGNLGYSWGRSSTDANFYNSTIGTLLFTTGENFKLNGVIGGGQVGYNYQNGNWVTGIEADFQGSGQRGSAIFNCGV